MAIKVVHEPEPKPGSLGKPELYALAIGQVIGAGVITLIVPAIKMTGYSACWHTLRRSSWALL